MINLLKLIDLLPYYFKQHDTYKDKDDKGILERFLEMIGESMMINQNPLESRYDAMIPTIDNILDIIDVEKAPGVFVDYIYEFLGYPPQYYKNVNSKDNYVQDPPNYIWWLEPDVLLEDYTLIGIKSKEKYYSPLDRKLIRYAISLYKIRGTEKFYRVLLTNYFKINDIELKDDSIQFSTTKVRFDTLIDYDAGYQYDGDATDCKACTNYIIDLTSLSDIDPKEKNRLTKVLTKYAPINTNLQVAFAYANVSIWLQGPDVPEGAIVYSGYGERVVGYENTVTISTEPNIKFLGWYDSNDNLLSTFFTYTFLVESNITLIAKYNIS